MIPTIGHSGKGEIMATVKKNQWLPRVREERGINKHTDDFRTMKLFCMIL